MACSQGCFGVLVVYRDSRGCIGTEGYCLDNFDKVL